MSLRKWQPPNSFGVLKSAEEILNIERQAFESSLLSLFNKRNHLEFIERLTDIKGVLQNISDSLEGIKPWIRTLEDFYLQQFRVSLIGLADMIILVCTVLDLKTKGIPYSHQQYRSGLALIEIEKIKCKKASELCNLHENWLKLTKK